MNGNNILKFMKRLNVQQGYDHAYCNKMTKEYNINIQS